MPATDPSLPPELSARYQVRRVLGAGSFGRVLLAHDQKGDREVAIKLLAHPPEGMDAQERFLREARVTAQLGHPGVLEVLDAGVTVDGGAYLVSEVLGESLAQVRAPPLASLMRWAEQVAEALDAAHRAGLVHRDVKPENILLRGEDAVLCDFGLAHVHGGRTVRTATGILLGTPPYMAPEIFRGEGSSPASDQWAWAATFYGLWQGRGVYPSGDLKDVLGAIQDFRAPAPPDGGRLGAVVTRALAGDPARRFPTMADLVGALRGADAGEDARAAPTVLFRGRAEEEAAPAAPRRWWWVPPVVASLVLLGAVATWPGDPRPPAPSPLPTTPPAPPGTSPLPSIDPVPLDRAWGEVIRSARELRVAMGIPAAEGAPVIGYLPRTPTGFGDEPGVLNSRVPSLWEAHLRASFAWGLAVARQDAFQRWTAERLPAGHPAVPSPLHHQAPPLLLFHRTVLSNLISLTRRFGDITGPGRAHLAAVRANDLTERVEALLLEHPASFGTEGLPVTWMLLVMRSRDRSLLRETLGLLIRETRAWEGGAHGLGTGMDVVLEGTRRGLDDQCRDWVEPLGALSAAIRMHADGPVVGCMIASLERQHWLDRARRCDDDEELWTLYRDHLVGLERCATLGDPALRHSWAGELDVDREVLGTAEGVSPARRDAHLPVLSRIQTLLRESAVP